MNKAKECAQYFRQQKEWNRCFQLLRRKWESLGKAGGKIVLNDCTPGERRAIGKMMGKVYWEEKVVFSLADFEKMLQMTRFAPITLHELLEEYFGTAIKAKQDVQEEKKQKKADFFQECRACFRAEKEKLVWDWLLHMEMHQSYGYSQLLRELGKDEAAAYKMMQLVGEAVISAQYEAEDIPIAVLAAKVSGNPHYLDRGSTAGNLFMQGLCFGQNKEFPKISAEWKERLLCAGILPDDISSMVTVLGIHLQMAEGLHPGVEEFCQRREALVLTALNLKTAAGAWVSGKRVYVVENEMVFTYLAERLRDDSPALLCTSGQLRNAALDLLQLLVDSGTQIYYSGDMDPEGMGIADRLWQRYPGRIHIWRMSPYDYDKAVSNEAIDDRSLAILKGLKNPQLQHTAEKVLKTQRAAYQENILEELLKDMNQAKEKQKEPPYDS